MGLLSCDCDYGGDWYITDMHDAPVPLATKRGRRCYSCNKSIRPGEPACGMARVRAPNCDYEENRFPDGVPMSDIYYCEACWEIYATLVSTGMCVKIGNMQDALREYWDITGFDPSRYLTPPIKGK